MKIRFLWCFLASLTRLADAACEADYWYTSPWHFGGPFQGQVSGDGLIPGDQCLEPVSDTPATNQILIDTTTSFQTMFGFGGAMTESSAYLISNHPRKQEILNFLFKPVTEGGIDLSMIRLPVSMMSDFVSRPPYTYTDENDQDLASFSIDKDKEFVIPLLKEALAIKPGIKFMSAAWSAPGWMKRNNNLNGEEFDDSYASTYAKYLRMYVEAYKNEGINIDFILPQNEPLHTANGYPTMALSPDSERTLTLALADELSQSGLDTKIIIYGHNWDNLEYARSILRQPGMTDVVGGVAFHCYAGDPKAPGDLARDYPDIPILFEECSGYYENQNLDIWSPTVLTWNQQNLFVGQPVDGSATSVLLWNIALDDNFGPNIAQQNPGGVCPGGMACGCDSCRGLLTLTNNDFQTNVDLWSVAHSSAFVPSGSVRIGSQFYGGVVGVAYRVPDGSIVVVAHTTYWDDLHDLSIIVDGSKQFFVPAVERETSITFKIYG